VFVPYSRPIRSPSFDARNPDDLITSGSVAPIRAVGTISTLNAMAKRMSVRSASESGRDG
jgi:hypothetical protein